MYLQLTVVSVVARLYFMTSPSSESGPPEAGRQSLETRFESKSFDTFDCHLQIDLLISTVVVALVRFQGVRQLYIH